ncbi:TonB-dependent receptor [Spongiibacter marinus]|uniref:TonB-dependent receptor n=1 Tax=Spongiibacter marinus TaxID=354246 RepID=UPI0035BE2346
MSLKFVRASKVAISSMLLCCGSVLAQDASVDPTETSSYVSDEGVGKSNRMLEEVLVTAQKRAEDPQDVPISLQAFGEEKLDVLGVTTQADLQELVPSLNLSSIGQFTTIYLRGIGTDAFLTADPSVATYIDGIYFPFSMGLSQDLGVLERIEVLKGPQGTLFGRNATGGAINVITRDPILSEFSARASVTVANYPELHAKAYLNVPIGDEFAFSVSPVYAKTEFYIKNTSEHTIRPMEDDETEAYRVKARWVPTDWFDMTVGYEDTYSSNPSASMFLNIKSTGLGKTIGIEDEPYKMGSDEAAIDDCCMNVVENEVLYGSAKLNFSWFDIKLLASDQKIITHSVFGIDGSDTRTLPLEITGPNGNAAEIQTAEIQFLSHEESWGSEWMKWVGGLYYFDGIAGTIGDGDRVESLLFPGVLGPVSDLLGTVSGLLDLLSPELGGLVPSGKIFATTTVTTESQAAFFQSTFTLTDWLDLTLAVRYQDESREMIESELGLLNDEGEETVLVSRNTAQKQDGTTVGPIYSEESWSPKVSIEMRPFGEDILFYANYQEATKSGTYNALAIIGEPTFAEPESIEAIELGAKTSFLQGTLVFNAALFDYQMENMQVQFLSVTNGGSTTFENAEAAHSRGLDIDFTWLVMPNWFEGLVMTGSLGWLETAEYTSYPDGRGYVDDSGFAQTGQDFSGNRIVKTPEYSGNLGLVKAWAFSDSTFELGGSVYFTEEFFNEPSNRKVSMQESYELYSVRASYHYQPYDLRVTLFGDNLTDEAYTRGTQPTEFGTLVTVGSPLTYGMRIAWQY